MPDTIRTKAELLLLMADNVSGDISPQDLRDFVLSNNVQEVQTETAPATILAETDFVIAAPGCTAITLPLVIGFGDRSLQIANASGGDLQINAAPFESIDNQLFITVTDGAFLFIGAESGGTDWVVIINTGNVKFTDLTDTPDDYSGQANKFVAVNPGEDALELVDVVHPKRIYQIMCGFKDPSGGGYLEWCNQQASDDTGYCIIRDGTIIAASVNRTDDDDANIEIRTPLGDTNLFTTDNQTVFDPLSIPVFAGDRIRARNTGPNTASNVVLSLLIEEA